jgi:hypothetical protein
VSFYGPGGVCSFCGKLPCACTSPADFFSVVRRISPDSFALTGEKAPPGAAKRASDNTLVATCERGCIFGLDGQGRESRPVYVGRDGTYLVFPKG